MNLLLSINIIVSIVQQNLPYKIYMKTSIFFFMNEFAFKYEYNCKYCLANKKLHLSIVLTYSIFFVPTWLNEKRFTKIENCFLMISKLYFIAFGLHSYKESCEQKMSFDR